MHIKDYLLLLIVAIIPFIIYAFNPNLAGADSYFYINYICGLGPPTDYTFMFLSVINFFPCNFLFIKAFMCLLWFGCLVFMAKTGELYDKENGILTALIMAGMTLFILSFFNFENDLVGYFLFFASFYYLIKYDKEKAKIDLGISIVLIGLAGLFWNGAIYWLMIYPLFWIGFLPLFIGLLIYNSNYTTFLFFLNADRSIAEHASIISVIYWGMTVLFLYGITKTDRKIAIAFLILCIPALFVVKLFVLCIPFIVLISFNALNRLKIDKKQLFYILVMFAIVGGGFFATKTFETFPTTADVEVIKMAIDYNVYTQNTFGVGYAVVHYGGIPSSAGSTNHNDYLCSGYVIEHTFAPDCNCPILLEGSSILLEKC